jgi:hypothetical protein
LVIGETCIVEVHLAGPVNPTVYFNLAAAYQKGGQTGMADEAMERYLELTGGSVKR